MRPFFQSLHSSSVRWLHIEARTISTCLSCLLPAARRENRFGSKTVRDLMGRPGRRAAAARATPPPMEWPNRCRGWGAREQQEETRVEKPDSWCEGDRCEGDLQTVRHRK